VAVADLNYGFSYQNWTYQNYMDNQISDEESSGSSNSFLE